MKKIQNYYLYSYRVVGFIFLTGLISSIAWYGFSMLFFIGSSNWLIPMILSPNQEKVMTHLEHVLILEHNLSKNIAELTAYEQSLKQKKILLAVTEQLCQRIEETLVAQSKQYAKNGRIFKKLSKEKNAAVVELRQLVEKVQKNETSTDKELQIGLITKQEALDTYLASNKIHSNLVDAKARLHELNQRSQDFSNAAHTINGATKNVIAMYNVVKKVEVENKIVQLKSDIFSLDVAIKQLQKNIEKKSKALSLMKNSPYIKATRSPTTVAFVSYRNLKHIKVGAPVYSCYFDMILCYQSGHVSAIYNAEEYFPHPVFKTELKGQLVGIAFNNKLDGQKKLLFINSKPLFI